MSLPLIFERVRTSNTFRYRSNDEVDHLGDGPSPPRNPGHVGSAGFPTVTSHPHFFRGYGSGRLGTSFDGRGTDGGPPTKVYRCFSWRLLPDLPPPPTASCRVTVCRDLR